MKTNYYALAVSICRGWVPELAFAQMLNQKFKAVDYADDMKALKDTGSVLEGYRGIIWCH